jgi:site-specific recombinase XerD
MITPHALRHNYITMCWEAGVDVYTTSKIVGHARIETTLRIYTHLTESAKQVAAEKLNDVFNSARCTNVAQGSPAPVRIEKIKALKSQ